MPQNKWQAEVGDISENEWKSYYFSTKTWQEVKHRDFQYKTNNTILVKTFFLEKNNKIDSGVSSYCKEQTGNTPCVFVVSNGQKLLERIKRMAKHQCQHYNIEIVNYIYALAKLFVYQNKFISRNINIQGYICLLRKKS